MNLYIQILDGQPFEHPIMEDNFVQAFPDIDVNNLPSNFARFTRLPCLNTANIFEKHVVSYEWFNGAVQDVWSVVPMTAEEREEKISQLRDEANAFVVKNKEIAQGMIDYYPEGEIRNAWIECKARLDAWVLVDVENPQIPPPPRLSSDGTRLLSLNTSSGVPNVIG